MMSDLMCGAGGAQPENLLFEKDDDYAAVVIADFGLAMLVDGDSTAPVTGPTMAGTACYLSPEVRARPLGAPATAARASPPAAIDHDAHGVQCCE